MIILDFQSFYRRLTHGKESQNGLLYHPCCKCFSTKGFRGRAKHATTKTAIKWFREENIGLNDVSLMEEMLRYRGFDQFKLNVPCVITAK